MTQILQLLPELQVIQVGLGDRSGPVEGSRKIARNGGDRVRIPARVDSLEESLPEVFGRTQEAIEGVRQALEHVGAAPVAAIDLNRVRILLEPLGQVLPESLRVAGSLVLRVW